jgi:hypothetical protein
MSSILRIKASRANGARSRGPVTPKGKAASAANSAKSTGPVTPEGKARVSQNATTHGMLAGSVVLTEEGAERFSAELSRLEDEFKPQSHAEEHFVRVMAVAAWRQTRIWCLEKEHFENETRKLIRNSPETQDLSPVACTALAFRTLSDDSKSLELLNRYEARYDRQYQRALACLRTYQISKQTEPNIGKLRRGKLRREK